MIRSAWDLLVHMTETVPPWLPPVILSWLISVALTQAVKTGSTDIPAGRRNLILRAVAASSAIAVCWGLWADTGLSPGVGFVAGLAVGLWSPLSWAILTRVVGKRWPHLRDVLAADGRRKE